MKPPQIGNIFCGEMKVFDIVDDLIQAGAYRIAPVSRVFAVEGIKNGNVMVGGFEIALHHGHFIEIGQ